MKTTILTVALALLLTCCTKQGATGPAGQNGVSNESITFYQATTWQNGNNDYSFSINDPAITNILDVDVQVSYSLNGTTYIALPASNIKYAGDYMQASYSNGVVNIYYYGNPAPGIMSFKVDVIPQ